MKPSWQHIHPHCKLNGTPCTFETLSKIGQALVKEGETFERTIGDFLLDWAAPQPYVEVYTSGSTGKPKKIPLQKQAMVNSALATGAFFALQPTNTALLCLPCSGIAGKMMLVRALMLGLHLDYVTPSSSPLQYTQKHYDFVAMVPLQVQNTLAQLVQIKTLLVGGAPVGNTLQTALQRVPTQVFETYGMTETLTHIAVRKLGKHATEYFETLPHVNVTVDDRGCLVIHAPQLVKDNIVTNDVVAQLGDTRFKWLGRYDSIINSGGIKLLPEQIEEKLSPLIHARFFVASLPDKVLGQQLVLLVENEEVSSTQLLQNIKALNTISKYEVPKHIFLLKAFVETNTGKIHRQKTLQRLEDNTPNALFLIQ